MQLAQFQLNAVQELHHAIEQNRQCVVVNCQSKIIPEEEYKVICTVLTVPAKNAAYLVPIGMLLPHQPSDMCAPPQLASGQPLVYEDGFGWRLEDK